MKNKYISVIIAEQANGVRYINEVSRHTGKKSILYQCVKAFDSFADEAVVAVHPDNVDFYLKELADLNFCVTITECGESFIWSLKKSFDAVNEKCSIVAVHDSVRPFVSPEEIKGVIAAAYGSAAIVGVKAVDTVKLAHDGVIKSTIDRRLLWSLKSPLAAKYEIVSNALKNPMALTHDCSNTAGFAQLLHGLSFNIKVIEGKYENSVV